MAFVDRPLITFHSTARVTIASLVLATTGCVSAGHLSRDQASDPIFDPITFFAGKTQGAGHLAIILHGSQSTLVEGSGVIQPDGSIILNQDVRRGPSSQTHRTWHLRRFRSGVYSGTLTDAIGPVTGNVTGNQLHLSFDMKGGLHAQQWLYLQPGGQVALNRMVVTKLGIAVASLDETIVRSPQH